MGGGGLWTDVIEKPTYGCIMRHGFSYVVSDRSEAGVGAHNASQHLGLWRDVAALHCQQLLHRLHLHVGGKISYCGHKHLVGAA